MYDLILWVECIGQSKAPTEGAVAATAKSEVSYTQRIIIMQFSWPIKYANKFQEASCPFRAPNLYLTLCSSGQKSSPIVDLGASFVPT